MPSAALSSESHVRACMQRGEKKLQPSGLCWDVLKRLLPLFPGRAVAVPLFTTAARLGGIQVADGPVRLKIRQLAGAGYAWR